MKKQTKEEAYWVIDTDSVGYSEGEFAARGPFPTQAAAERAVILDTKETWGDACACLQSDTETRWCKPLHIVKVCRTVMPKIEAKVRLEDV